jgi:hypothetical protein
MFEHILLDGIERDLRTAFDAAATGFMVLARSRTKERVMARIPRLCAKEQGKRLAEVAKEIAEDDTRSYDGHFRGYMKGW